ncbi:U-box domain-containing protein 3 [Linum grandiflorum]
MLDPVIVASGQTYERSAIRKWLDHGLTVCPKTRQTLSHTNLIPNYTVKAMIANWCQENKAKLTQEHAVTALLNLSIHEENKNMIAEAGAIEPLIHVLNSGSDTAKENSAATLFSLSVLEEYKSKIGRSGAVKALVNLLSSGTLRGKKDAATALFNLSIFHENKARIVQAGAVKHLVELMEPATGMVDKSVALLANLSTVGEGRLAIARAGGIPLLVEVVESGSQRGKENAASVLVQLCLNNPKYCTLVLQEGAVPPLVALSQSGTPRAREKVRY